MYVYTNHHDEWPPPNEEQGTRDRATQAHKPTRGNECPQQPAQVNKGSSKAQDSQRKPMRAQGR